MTPAEYEALRDAILTREDCAALAVTSEMPKDPEGPAKDASIAALISEGRTRPDPVEKLSSLGLSSRMPSLDGLPGPLAAEMVLQRIEALATTLAATEGDTTEAIAARLFGAQIKRQLVHLAGEGIAFGDPAMHTMLEQMVALGGITQEHADALMSVSVVGAPVSAADVSRALRGPWE